MCFFISSMRLDNLLVKKNIFDSRTKAKQAIERGEILINDKQIIKASLEFNEHDSLSIKRVCEEDFVSLGGFKLSKALKDFSFDVNNLICADLGASTGGFTDCLLQNGAIRVHAVDVGVDQLVDKLRHDSRVVVKEHFNARYMTPEDLGILRTGEREFVILTSQPMTADTLALKIADVTALREDFQGTSGPYRLTDEGADEIRLERNPGWKGNASAYPADVIRCISR